jgi:hypothetical protein
VARKGIDATAEDCGGLALVKLEFLAHMRNETRINNRCIHLFGEGVHFAHDALRFWRVQDRFGAGPAEITRHR